MTPYAIVAYEPGAANIIDRTTNTIIGQVLLWAGGWGAFIEGGTGELAFGTTTTEPRYLDLHGPTRTNYRTRYRKDAAARVWAEYSARCVNCGDTPTRARQRCVRCLKYLYRHGEDRPEDLAIAYFAKLA